MPVAPAISIITTVFNRERYLPLAIESVLAQVRSDWELIIWDDGSSDSSRSIAREFAARDPRIRSLGGERQGLSASMRDAIEASTGLYVGILDSDDLLERRALHDTAALLDGDPELGVVYTDYVTIDASGRLLGYGSRCRIPYSPERLLVDFMTFHFRLLRRRAYASVGGVNLSMELAPDYDLCLRLSEKVAFAHLPEPRYFYRVHDKAISSEQREQQGAYSKRAVEEALQRRGLSTRLEVDLSPNGGLRLRPKGA